jgi:uncharacterized protein
MIQIGRMNRLSVKGTHAYGLHLDGGEAGDILLRGKYSPDQYRRGDTIDAFVYVDRDQRLLASLQSPAAMVGEFACLPVVTRSTNGAFLDWGLESDLFVPISEQQEPMREGRSYVVYIFLSDKSSRITGSSKLAKFLNRQPPKYMEGEEVDLLICTESDLGYSAVVNGLHLGMIYENEVFQKLVVGQRLKGYIKKIREDRKIDLRLQKPGYGRVDDISRVIIDTLKAHGGMVAITDKSPPEEVYALFGVSKKVFKQAIGALYKKRSLVIGPDGIRIAE